MKAAEIFAVKVAVSIATLYLVSGSIAWDEVGNVLKQAQFSLLMVALAIFWTAQFFSSLRCAYIARVLGGHLDIVTSLRAHFVGLWFNQVLPTSLGGDVVKIAILKNRVGLSLAIRAAILDRFSGLMFLLMAVALTLPLYARIFASHADLVISLGIIALGGWLATIAGAWSARRIPEALRVKPVLGKVVRIFADLWEFRKGLPLWQQGWTSAIVHFNGIVTFFLIGAALGVKPDFILFLLVVPIVFLFALIPVSYAGWGVREAGAVWLFGMIGIPSESAVAMSLSFGLFLIVAGLPGLLILNIPLKRSLDDSAAKPGGKSRN